MTQVEIKDETARRLAELAERSNRSVDDLLQLVIQQLVNTGVILVDDADVSGNASRLLEMAEKMNFSSGQTDTSERSREILDDEFGDYLNSRIS